jgi:hypothetical protein
VHVCVRGCVAADDRHHAHTNIGSIKVSNNAPKITRQKGQAFGMYKFQALKQGFINNRMFLLFLFAVELILVPKP